MSREIISRRDEDDGDELLADHSAAVAKLAPTLVDGDEDPVIAVAGRLHDLGKATPYFQRHVRDERVRPAKNTYHARMGAFATFHVLSETGASDRDRLAGLLGVLKHHGRLPNAAEKLVDIAKAERREDSPAYLGAQVAALDEDDAGRAVADALLTRASGGAASWESFEIGVSSGRLYEGVIELVGEETDIPTLVGPDPERIPPGTYDRTLDVWSAVTLADKTCAAGVADDERLRPASLDLAKLESWVERRREDAGLAPPPAVSGSDDALDVDVTDGASLNQIREAVRRFVRGNARTLAETDCRIATLTLPTGLGKTFTGLTAAYTIRDAVEHRELGEDHDPRVIYALPYTSIIEQTRGAFEDVFDADPTGRAFTVHSSLVDTVTYPDVDADANAADRAIDDSKYFTPARFAEAWRAGTTLTTFVQLFESLTGPTNARGLKLPALHDAVVILDEPQTLPKPWWPAIRHLIRLLTEEYGAHVISMTATQPSLVTAADFDTVSLLSETQAATAPLANACATAVKRVTYHVDDSLRAYTSGYDPDLARDYAAAGTRLVERVADGENSTRSALAVCNTIASTVELADATKDAVRARDGTVTDLGSAYLCVLDQTAQLESDQFDPSALDDRPGVDDLAGAVLEKLGFSTSDPREEPVTDATWTPPDVSDDVIVGSFSSRYRPRDRRVLIAVATVLARSSVPFVLVSTQAVEAGVDISFGAVYRDLAPLDSVVQAAGRCNRSFEWGRGEGDVTVWALGPTANSTELPARFIYPAAELSMVASILQDRLTTPSDPTIPDDVLANDAIPRYYDWLETETDVENRALTTALEQCNAEDLTRYHLIDQAYEAIDVLVAHTRLERVALDELTRRLRSCDPDDRAAGFELLNQLNDLRVSAPVTELEDVPSSIRRVDAREMRAAEGTPVLCTSDSGTQKLYDLTDGGLRVTDVISDRFSI
jgi:CRISPR-associated endonuclease/helicase Cas3/CRISPR-associated endonuclease Cas3-HD